MKITFHFVDDPIDLYIDLIDNPAIHAWSQHFLSPEYSADAHHSKIWVTHEWDPTILQQQLDLCHHCISQLNELGFHYDGPLPSTIDQMDREWTNKSHRFFTHIQKEVHAMVTPARSKDERWINLQNKATVFLQDLNDAIHKIELYLPYCSAPVDIHELHITHQPKFNAPGWWKIIAEHRQYHSKEHHDVILGPQILGKTLLQSFLDGDDPNDWDTTGHYNNFGFLVIQLGPETHEDVYNRADFKQWLGEYHCDPDKMWYDFPLGNIQDKTLLEKIKTHLDIDNKVPVTVSLS